MNKHIHRKTKQCSPLVFMESIRNGGSPAKAQQCEYPPVYSADLPPPQLSRSRYEKLFAETKSKMKHQDMVRIKQTEPPSIEHGVAPSLELLRHTTMREVAKKVNKIHQDCVLFVKTIYRPCHVANASILVEDEEGTCLMLSVYNFIQPSKELDEVFPVGTCLALLAPYILNVNDDKYHNLILRCDNPQCIIKFESEASWLAAKTGCPEPPVTENPSMHREKGNAAFQKKNIRDAAKFYSKALKSDTIQTEDKVACLSNRAEVMLREEKWESAEEDTRAALFIDSEHLKSKYRLGKALMRLSQPSEALKIAKWLLAKNPNERSFRELLSDSQRLTREQIGVYDIKMMRRELLSSKKLGFHADFVSPAIEIGVEIKRPNAGTYRGCKAVEDIDAGELITASKVFVFIPTNKSSLSLQVGTCENQVSQVEQMQLVNEVVELLHRRPKLGRSLYLLTAGDEYPNSVPSSEVEKINLSRIRCILNSNAFLRTSDHDGVLFEWKRLMMEQNNDRPLTEPEVHKINSMESNGVGLWINESLFNHSCTPNCTWNEIGDHMFMRTSRPVKAGEELCITYTGLQESYSERKRIFEHWAPQQGSKGGFVCACDWCNLMRSNQKLRSIEAEVDAAYKKAARKVSVQGISMAEASAKAMSRSRRREIFAAFSHLPLRFQHNTIAMLEVIEGNCLKQKGDSKGALEAYERAADVGYEVRGGACIERAKDLWRIVGASMCCDDVRRASEAMHEIWSSVFTGLPEADGRAAFVQLTIKHSLHWWLDEYDFNRQRELEELAREVWGKKTGGNGELRGRGRAQCIRSRNR